MSGRSGPPHAFQEHVILCGRRSMLPSSLSQVFPTDTCEVLPLSDAVKSKPLLNSPRAAGLWVDIPIKELTYKHIQELAELVNLARQRCVTLMVMHDHGNQFVSGPSMAQPFQKLMSAANLKFQTVCSCMLPDEKLKSMHFKKRIHYERTLSRLPPCACTTQTVGRVTKRNVIQAWTGFISSMIGQLVQPKPEQVLFSDSKDKDHSASQVEVETSAGSPRKRAMSRSRSRAKLARVLCGGKELVYVISPDGIAQVDPPHLSVHPTQTSVQSLIFANLMSLRHRVLRPKSQNYSMHILLILKNVVVKERKLPKRQALP